jgi:uncharacterized protein
MRYRLLDEQPGHRVISVAMEVGDQAVAKLLELATELDLRASEITGVGGFHGAKLAFFDVDNGTFIENQFDEQFEVAAFVGNLTREEGSDAQHLHAHVVLGLSDGTTRGGHLVEATVRPTLELMIHESPANVPRGTDSKTGWVVMKP